jgi:hydrogenase-4 component E
VVAVLVLAVKGVVLPAVLLRMIGSSGETREVEPLVNVPASLLAAAALTLLAYATTRELVALDSTPQTRALPIGIAVVLIGFFALVTRRKAVTQIVGFLLLDNGIALVAFLATSGVPLVVELGVALDVLLAVFILQVLGARMRTKFGAMDLDVLRELHD